MLVLFELLACGYLALISRHLPALMDRLTCSAANRRTAAIVRALIQWARAHEFQGPPERLYKRAVFLLRHHKWCTFQCTD